MSDTHAQDQQQQFALALLTPERGVEALQALTAQNADQQNVRFNVYRNNVMSALTDALLQGFPVSAQLLGEEYFRAMAGIFIREQPPKTPVLNEYGADLPDFMRAFPPLSELRYIADIAELEWCRRCAFHSVDALALTPEKFSARSKGPAIDDVLDQRLYLHPSLRILRSDFPVLSLWLSQVRSENDDANAIVETIDWSAQTIMIWRPEFDVLQQILSPMQEQLQSALQNGARLSDALHSVNADGNDIDELVQILMQWLNTGVFMDREQ